MGSEELNSDIVKKLADYLGSPIRDPWRGLTRLGCQLVCKQGGFEHLPPIFSIIAAEGESPEDHGFQHGSYVSIVDKGLDIGGIETPDDIPFIIVFGSRIWNDASYFKIDSRIENTQEHELAHLLTLFALFQITKAGRNTELVKSTIKNLLGGSLWEAMADLLCNHIKYVRKEQKFKDESAFADLLKEETLLHRSTVQNRLMSEFMTGLLLRIWQGEDVDEISYDGDRGKKAAEAFLLRIHGANELRPEGEDGWLVKKIFRQDKFNWREAVDKIRKFDGGKIFSLLEPLRRVDGGGEVADFLHGQLEEKISAWDPFV